MWMAARRTANAHLGTCRAYVAIRSRKRTSARPWGSSASNEQPSHSRAPGRRAGSPATRATRRAEQDCVGPRSRSQAHIHALSPGCRAESRARRCAIGTSESESGRVSSEMRLVWRGRPKPPKRTRPSIRREAPDSQRTAGRSSYRRCVSGRAGRAWYVRPQRAAADRDTSGGPIRSRVSCYT
ncbi:hypothetical protein C8Q77DRAFT_509434 [Trametes polyzona]|nr:hypothetical protein C8Q77DRAFT_509434 [Trametes polyzona]